MNINPGRYIVAVSGGVDSVVLLDMLVKYAFQISGVEFIVAHFDHGIRADSVKDAGFVADLAEKYKLPFEIERAELGVGASEAEARDARYDFLKRTQKKYKADAIITAHHRDDLLETSIINMLRGTGHRGLFSLRNRKTLLRPLLQSSKQDIYEYAKKNKLVWRDDATNQDVNYLRNRIRLNLIPKSKNEWREKMHQRIAVATELGEKIDTEINQLVSRQIKNNQLVISRGWFVGLPHNIALEVIIAILRRIGASDINKDLVEILVLRIKTAKPGKKLDIDRSYLIQITKRSARLVSRTTQKTVRV